MKSYAIIVSVLGLLPVTAAAQKWEVGAAGGGSFYTSNDVEKGNSSVKASFEPGFVASFFVSQEMGRHWGGDLRYDFARNNAKLDGAGGKATFGAQSHSIHYDFLLFFSPAGNKTRAFISFGAGIRQFRGTGNEGTTQALSEYALLTKSSDTTPMASVGVGVKFRVGKNSNVRIEVKDYITPQPTKVITPNRGASLSGWIHNFLPMVGVTYVF